MDARNRMKLPSLPIFHGQPDESVYDWIDLLNAKEKFECNADVTAQHKVVWAYFYTAGRARNYLHRYVVRSDRDFAISLPSFEDFCTVMTNVFGRDYKKIECDFLCLRQGDGDLTTYIGDFMTLAGHITWPEKIKMMAFYNGLTQVVKVRAGYRDNLGLQELIDRCEHADRELKASQS